MQSLFMLEAGVTYVENQKGKNKGNFFTIVKKVGLLNICLLFTANVFFRYLTKLILLCKIFYVTKYYQPNDEYEWIFSICLIAKVLPLSFLQSLSFQASIFRKVPLPPCPWLLWRKKPMDELWSSMNSHIWHREYDPRFLLALAWI